MKKSLNLKTLVKRAEGDVCVSTIHIGDSQRFESLVVLVGHDQIPSFNKSLESAKYSKQTDAVNGHRRLCHKYGDSFIELTPRFIEKPLRMHYAGCGREK